MTESSPKVHGKPAYISDTELFVQSETSSESPDQSSGNGQILATPPPDGGLRACLQVIAGHFVVFNTWGYVISFGIFQPYYQDLLGMPPSAISWIGSLQTSLIFLLAPISGLAFDAGYHRLLMLLGCSLEVLGIFATASSTKYWQLFLAQGVCQGIGCGLLFTPTVASLSMYFDKNRVMALSLAACGGSTGGVVFPVIAQTLLPRIGFSWTVRTMGFIVLMTSIVIVGLSRTRTQPQRRVGRMLDLAAVKEPAYILFSLSMFVTLWATFFAYSYARLFMLNRLQGSQFTSFTVILVMNVVGIPGRLISAYLAEKVFGVLHVFIVVIFLAAMLQFAWIGVTSVVGEFVWAAAYGLFGSAIQTLFPVASTLLTRDPTRNGTRIGIIFGIVSIAVLTGPPLAGEFIQAAGGSYIPAQVWAGLCLLLGAAFLVAVRWTSLPTAICKV